MIKTIFLSYSWDDSKIANSLEAYFESVNIESMGFEIKRDIRQKLKINLKKFMQGVKTTDYVIPIISHNYLRSSNCMYEASEVLKSKDYRKRVVPIITSSANLFTPEGKATYIRYWEDRIQNVKDSLKSLNNPQHARSILDDIRKYEKILSNLDDFATLISSDLGFRYEDNNSQSYSEILDYIGFSEIPTIKIRDEILAIENRDEQDERIENAAIQFPKDKHILLAKALIKEKQQFYKSAIVIYEKLIAMYKSFPLPYIHLSDIRLREYETIVPCDFSLVQKAKEILEIGIKENPTDDTLTSRYSILLLTYYGPAS
jgi:tetratricopeptide (TPR) repeat protein